MLPPALCQNDESPDTSSELSASAFDKGPASPLPIDSSVKSENDGMLSARPTGCDSLASS